MNKVSVFIYLLILAVHLIAPYFDMPWLANGSKPLLLSFLISAFFVGSIRTKKTRFFRLILAGLIFSLVGDVMLIFQEDDSLFFIGGLSSFLLAHIAYIFAFIQTYRQEHDIALIKRHGWLMLGVFAYAYFFFKGLQAHLGEMMGPVMIYCIAISVMLILAINRYKRVGDASFWGIFIGAVLFVASDSLLAWNKFVDSLPHAHLGIMLTYGMAQLAICWGALEQVKDQAVEKS